MADGEEKKAVRSGAGMRMGCALSGVHKALTRMLNAHVLALCRCSSNCH